MLNRRSLSRRTLVSPTNSRMIIPVKERKMSTSCHRNIVITDPMYEEIIEDLVSAGTILTKCTHNQSGGACDLCKATWEGCVSNANEIRRGKRVLGGKK